MPMPRARARARDNAFALGAARSRTPKIRRWNRNRRAESLDDRERNSDGRQATSDERSGMEIHVREFAFSDKVAPRLIDDGATASSCDEEATPMSQK